MKKKKSRRLRFSRAPVARATPQSSLSVSAKSRLSSEKAYSLFHLEGHSLATFQSHPFEQLPHVGKLRYEAILFGFESVAAF